MIGALHLVGLVYGLFLTNPLQISFELICMSTFLYMLWRDKESNRLLYFCAYCVSFLMLATIHLVFVFWDHDEKSLVRAYCHDIEEKVVNAQETPNGWSVTDFKDYNDCREQMGLSVMRDEFLIIFLMAIFQVHFALVLYTHYKNSHLLKAKGGCAEGPPDIQMGGFVGDFDLNRSSDAGGNRRV